LAEGETFSPTSAATFAFARYSAGRLAIYQGDYATATTLLEDSLATARRNENNKTMMFVVTQLGHLALYRGDFAGAKAWYAEGLAIRRTLDDPRGIAIMTGSLGRVALFAGDIAEARALLEESLAIFRHVVAHTDTIGILCDLGYVAIEQQQYDRARAHLTEALLCSREWDIKQGSAQCLEGFAVLSAARRQPERAIRLAGAGASLRRMINYPLPPILQEWLTRSLASARQSLGEPRYQEAYTAGAALPIAEAVAEALASERPAASGDSRSAGKQFGGLSAREREVVTQLVTGKTNRRIAEELYIAEKTVELHITNSLRKFGFHTRAELAVWASRNGLGDGSAPPPKSIRSDISRDRSPR
jgi:non-specific serine/threonine protein kinase